MKRKILVVDDSALMRSVLCDIINSDERFRVVDRATNGLEALDLLSRNEYEGVVLDINMPKMNGIELLKELKRKRITTRIMVASTDTKQGAKVTLDALELGAIDCVHKPDQAVDARGDDFREHFLRTLDAVTQSVIQDFGTSIKPEDIQSSKKVLELVRRHSTQITGNRVVAIASSTGGPKALQQVIPLLPKELDAPVLVVQHMPVGFTKSLAERLDTLSEVNVKEAEDGDVLKPGWVYIAMGGRHMKTKSVGGRCTIYYSDEPTREGVRPCANYMYESLMESTFDEVVCVVLTGMGSDGTKGIENLKTRKKLHVIAQEQSTCAVYGMPKSVVVAGLSNQIVSLGQVAQEIIMNVGVK
jgi:two-component system chemotaxis response regulator CheB